MGARVRLRSLQAFGTLAGGEGRQPRQRYGTVQHPTGGTVIESTRDRRVSAGGHGPKSQTCPLCAPRRETGRFWIEISSLSVSTLYLDRNQTYQGQCAMVFDPRHVEGLEHLDNEEYTAFSRDLRIAGLAVASVCEPDLMNYASLGNVIPHLHWHIVPRYETDPRWGGPIYTTTREEMHQARLEESAYESLVVAIRGALEGQT